MFNPWETTEDGQRRTITYTVSINHAIGPKHSPTTEQQVSFGKKKVHFLFRISKYIINQVGYDKNANQGLVDLIYNQILGAMVEKCSKER